MDFTTFVNIAGHTSFVLAMFSWMMKDMVKLRLLALSSWSVGMIYNYNVNGGPLWIVIAWCSLFMLINIVQLLADIRGRMEVQVPPRERAILAEAFPTMHSRDWNRLIAAGDQKHHDRGETLLEIGGKTDAVTLLIAGNALERRSDGREIVRGPSAMWGELSYVTDDAFDGSPCRMEVLREGTTTISWKYDTLRKICAKNDRLRAALMDGFVRNGCTKHGLMEIQTIRIGQPHGIPTQPNTGTAHAMASNKAPSPSNSTTTAARPKPAPATPTLETLTRRAGPWKKPAFPGTQVSTNHIGDGDGLGKPPAKTAYDPED